MESTPRLNIDIEDPSCLHYVVLISTHNDTQNHQLLIRNAWHALDYLNNEIGGFESPLHNMIAFVTDASLQQNDVEYPTSFHPPNEMMWHIPHQISSYGGTWHEARASNHGKQYVIESTHSITIQQCFVIVYLIHSQLNSVLQLFILIPSQFNNVL